MGNMIRCPKCGTHHYANDPCPDFEDRMKKALDEVQFGVRTEPVVNDDTEVEWCRMVHYTDGTYETSHFTRKLNDG